MRQARLTEDDAAKLELIQALLDDAYDHYFEHSAGHCKRSEGYIEIRLPNYFNRKKGDTTVGVGVYSYVLGPHRMHDFDTIDSALEAVTKWHHEEMNTTYEEPEWE